MCTEICDGAGAGLCDGASSTCCSFFFFFFFFFFGLSTRYSMCANEKHALLFHLESLYFGDDYVKYPDTFNPLSVHRNTWFI